MPGQWIHTYIGDPHCGCWEHFVSFFDTGRTHSSQNHQIASNPLGQQLNSIHGLAGRGTLLCQKMTQGWGAVGPCCVKKWHSWGRPCQKMTQLGGRGTCCVKKRHSWVAVSKNDTVGRPCQKMTQLGPCCVKKRHSWEAGGPCCVKK